MTTNHALALLEALGDASPYLVPERTLFADLCNRLARPPTRTEFSALLADQEGRKRILSQRNEEGELKWKITDNGLARLAELRR